MNAKLKDFLAGVMLLAGLKTWLVVYTLAMTGFMFLLTFGLEITGEHSASLWGLRLNNFGFSGSEIVAAAYTEFVFHAWWVALICLSTVAFRGVLMSWEPGFENLLRHGRKSRLYVELLRMSAIFLVMLIILLPFLLAAALAFYRLHLPVSDCQHLFHATAAPLLLTALAFHLLAIRPATHPLCRLVFLTPLLLGGIQTFLARQSWLPASHLLLPGLPYTLPETTAALTFHLTLAITLTALLLRLAAVSQTQWVKG